MNLFALPENNRPIKFKTKIDNNEYLGLYLSDEKIFFVGFNDEGSYFTQEEICEWSYFDKDILEIL